MTKTNKRTKKTNFKKNQSKANSFQNIEKITTETTSFNFANQFENFSLNQNHPTITNEKIPSIIQSSMKGSNSTTFQTDEKTEINIFVASTKEFNLKKSSQQTTTSIISIFFLFFSTIISIFTSASAAKSRKKIYKNAKRIINSDEKNTIVTKFFNNIFNSINTDNPSKDEKKEINIVNNENETAENDENVEKTKTSTTFQKKQNDDFEILTSSFQKEEIGKSETNSKKKNLFKKFVVKKKN